MTTFTDEGGCGLTVSKHIQQNNKHVNKLPGMFLFNNNFDKSVLEQVSQSTDCDAINQISKEKNIIIERT